MSVGLLELSPCIVALLSKPQTPRFMGCHWMDGLRAGGFNIEGHPAGGVHNFTP
jgi:hypothetical protein